MYKLNELQRFTLITPDEVLFHAPVKDKIDRRMIMQSIIIAEERFIRPALCSTFYDALLASKNRIITSGNIAATQDLVDDYYKNAKDKPRLLTEGDIVNASEFLSSSHLDLWKTILWKLTAEAVVAATLPEAYVQLASEGAIHNQPGNSPLSGSGVVTPDLRSIKWAMDKKLFDRIDPLIESMHRWLCEKRDADDSLYTDYLKKCDCNSKGVSYKRKTDIILGIYSDSNSDYLDRRDPLRHPDCDDCGDC